MCTLCNNGEVEDERHFVTKCDKLEKERKAMKEEIGSLCDITDLTGFDLMKKLLEPECVKVTAKHLLNMLDRRRELMYE